MIFRLSLLMLILFGCGSNPVSPVSEDLSRVLSVTNLSKLPIRDPQNTDLIVGLSIDVDVVNTAVVSIDIPFVMTWALRDGNGTVLGRASKRLTGLPARGRERVLLTISFSARADLNGIRDEVTFDAIEEEVGG